MSRENDLLRRWFGFLAKAQGIKSWEMVKYTYEGIIGPRPGYSGYSMGVALLFLLFTMEPS